MNDHADLTLCPAGKLPMTEGWYDRHALPGLVDRPKDVHMLTRLRAWLTLQAHGRVPAVGQVDGRNLRNGDATKLWQVVRPCTLRSTAEPASV